MLKILGLTQVPPFQAGLGGSQYLEHYIFCCRCVSLEYILVSLYTSEA